MEAKSVLKNRQTCRNFNNTQISDKELDYILKAGNSAPVSLGQYQKVELHVIQNKEILNNIEQLVYSVNPQTGKHPFYNAPTVILVSAKKEDAMELYPLAYCNASCIIENMMLASTDLKLGSVYLYAVPAVLGQLKNACPDLYRELNIKDGFFPVAMMAVGNSAAPFKDRDFVKDKISTVYID
ncbi:MAG: nitroreductase family protein [Clostridiales bacterium]|nr:nitroreductase family protein [Clostridiales bacterium]